MKVGLVRNASKTEQEAAIEQLQAYLQENGYVVTRFLSHLDIEGVDVVLGAEQKGELLNYLGDLTKHGHGEAVISVLSYTGSIC